MMTRLLPFPLLSAGLLALWLLLNQSLAPGQVLIGIAAALVGGWALTALAPPKARVRRIPILLRLAGLVVADIVRSNIAVARLILTPHRREITSGFVDIPLTLRDPYGLAMLASIITATPGTVWVNFDAASGTLTIHVLDLVEEQQWIATVKGRYEQCLLEIFE
jgi:multicomponent K+:H+ antiporter subunit E